MLRRKVAILSASATTPGFSADIGGAERTAHGRDHRGPGSGQDINGFTAVDRISFSVAAGRIFALIGPNGADKTTAIKDADLT
jgi:ABC-type multidrug transport system ATPase subunit